MAFGLDTPEQQRTVLFVLLLAGLGYVFWSYLYTPLRDERGVVEDRLATLQGYNDQGRALTQPARLRELERQEAEYQVQLAEYETLLPSAAEVPTLLEEVAFAAIETEVKVINFAPLPEVPGETLTEYPYDVQVQGDYHDVGRFLASVVSFPRIVRPTVTELLQADASAVQGLTTAPQTRPETGPAGQEGPPPEYEVLATLRLSTFVPAAVAVMELGARGADAARDVATAPGKPVATAAAAEDRDES
jgi:Tfp pilus assembly protein PilO